MGTSIGVATEFVHGVKVDCGLRARVCIGLFPVGEKEVGAGPGLWAEVLLGGGAMWWAIATAKFAIAPLPTPSAALA